MSRSHAALRLIRVIHLYFGVFISPALLFFAFTGALQTFNLHESGRSSSYQPPKWIVGLAQLHKKQTLVVPPRRPRPGGADADGGSRGQSGTQGTSDSGIKQPAKTPDPTAPKPAEHLPMKIFFLMIAVGLFTSTLTGIYMAYRYCRGPWIISGLLAVGVVLPMLLLPL